MIDHRQPLPEPAEDKDRRLCELQLHPREHICRQRRRALIDAAATFPFFIELAIGYELPTLTWLRLLRCFRILKTEKATRALSSIYRVIWCVESYWCR